ncbi:hypothetical protein [Geodermatophilus sp. URMC 62]|uniref:hypothetical protein n=1 Tax=Geodermatophilus sp. URMC 62 TaxID=3423414 RepID=UPI00406C8FF7
MPNLLRAYQAGQLELDELVTREYTLDQVAEAYEDVHAGRAPPATSSSSTDRPGAPREPPDLAGRRLPR